ncbi:hypothetical protein AW14_14580 [Siansivirga zeaxanthinifaciens CC-SAMT-1]|uniref:Uncharacterized protein n=1 Tax=Siansivirga zeaxanthinifaciens CC-SAMT-1 TaxID=1454006 RepID=A0A0C5WFP5_9FLAO|nr:hypothetical protein AW14_14580 [Siansivirga zeaxanthinifaciens CC-SAMT-1]
MKIKLLNRAIAKKIPETTLIFVVVLDCSKLTLIVTTNVIAKKTKLPKLNNILFSLSLKLYKP